MTGLSTLAVTGPAAALDNAVARPPPIGWNDGNSFGCNVSEPLIKQLADTIASSGPAGAGHQYVVVDACWFNPNRDSAGNLQGDPSRFPRRDEGAG